MRNITGRDIQFTLNTLGLGMLFIALLQAFGPYLGKPDPQRHEVFTLIRQIVDVPPADLPAMLHRADGKGTMVVAYASWCPYCKQLMPNLAELVKTNQMGRFVPMAISVDERSDFLAMYLVHNDLYHYFTPYRMESGLVRALQNTGSHFVGHIPYIGFYNAQGQVVGELPGLTDKARLQDAIARLSASL